MLSERGKQTYELDENIHIRTWQLRKHQFENMYNFFTIKRYSSSQLERVICLCCWRRHSATNFTTWPELDCFIWKYNNFFKSFFSLVVVYSKTHSNNPIKHQKIHPTKKKKIICAHKNSPNAYTSWMNECICADKKKTASPKKIQLTIEEKWAKRT
jgi:hypothetical protein